MLLEEYPDHKFVDALCNAVRYGVYVGYDGPVVSFRGKNLPTVAEDPEALFADLAKNIHRERACRRPSAMTTFMCSPIGLVPKPGGSWRRIHHLSFPKGSSVNDHIPEPYGRLKYHSFEEAIRLLAAAGPGAILVKRDLADAFRHIPVHPDCWWLLGFHWDGTDYHEMFLPFGLRTAPRIFNYFAEALHWILEHRSQNKAILHYLDDFLGIFTSLATAQLFAKVFQQVCGILGFGIKESKDMLGTTVDFLGLELDSVRMEARLPEEKKQKAIHLLQYLAMRRFCTLLDIQRLTGLLNFASNVVPLGRAFCRRLYDAEQGASSPNHHIKINNAMRADIKWWLKLLPAHSGIRLISPTRPTYTMWTDAAGTKGIGAFISSGHHGAIPHAAVFQSLKQDDILSSRLRFKQRDEHINIKEMLAILAAFRRWGKSITGHEVYLYCDNTAVVCALRRKTTRGRLMQALRKVLLSAALLDVLIVPTWLPSKDNFLADALSRFDQRRIADYAPQLKLPQRTLLG
jgi:hypothetical protein